MIQGWWKCGVILAAALIVVANATPANATAAGAKPSAVAVIPRPVIIDTDPGADDALAILLALNSPELDVRAITVVPGNVTAEQGLENARKLVSVAGRCEIPVAGGPLRPLVEPLTTAEFWHGRNGLGDVDLPPSKCAAEKRWAPDLIIEMVRAAPHQITVVALGPLTNIALALQKDPSIAGMVKGVVLMGGSISGGNRTPAGEANIVCDPEAAQIVFRAGWPLTMVGLDVTNVTLFTRADLDHLAKTHGPVNDVATGIFTFLIRQADGFGAPGTPMFDPLAVGVAIDPGIVTTQAFQMEVETKGEFTRGETVANRLNVIEETAPHDGRMWVSKLEKVKPNVDVATKVDARRFIEMLKTRLEGR